jgi:glycosyltransferase involved in cell wall biosynthesis
VAVPVTGIILTFNEEVNIRPCLKGLRRLDDIIIVDSGSTDGTLDLAREVRPDVRIFEHPFKDFGEQRNWALDHTGPRHEWLLFVDADEYATPEIIAEIESFVADPAGKVGGFIAGKNYFLGRWLKHTMMYPSYQLRLLKHGAVRFQKEGHGQREVTDGALHYLRESWRHEPFSKGTSEWIARHNRYSTEEAGLLARLRSEPIVWTDLFNADPILRRRELKRAGARMPLRPLVHFLYRYLLRGGFLDGYPGLLYCLLLASNDLHVSCKIAQERYDRTVKGAVPPPEPQRAKQVGGML